MHSKNHDKMMQNLDRLISRQNFKDEEELRTFFNGLAGQSLDNLPADFVLSPEEQAQDLVMEAYDLPPAKAKKNIERALSLDPNCIEAYECLAEHEKDGEKALEFFQKGVKIGRKKFGGKFLKENKGKFWGIHETRPFMSCLASLATMLIYKNKHKESVAIMEEMLELNPNDNQGMRHILLSVLLRLGEYEKFRKYDKMFKDEASSAALLYNRALFLFKTEGDTVKTQKALKKAYEANPFVIVILFDEKFQIEPFNSYSIGSPEEAMAYLAYGIFAWIKDDENMEWLAKMLERILKEIERLK
jgi:tetratricopeptide (TPR) repeat protein